MTDAQTDMRKLCSYAVWREEIDFLSGAYARDFFSPFAKAIQQCFVLTKRVVEQYTP